MAQNKQWIFKQRPTGDVSDEDIVLETSEIPVAEDGEIVVRTQYISLDPANRAWMNETPTYMDPVPLGGPMLGLVMGEVTDSGSEKFKPGDKVTGLGSWSEYCKVSATAFNPAPEVPGIDERDIFGIFTIVGPTAYFGIEDICAPKPGETMVVSGAAGAVGSIAGQMGKAHGCRVIGIAGGAKKCGYITDNYGMDAAIDYKNEDVAARLAELCPDGIDSFFDNVGGAILGHVLARMNNFGRIAQCGAISMYNAAGPVPGPYNYMNVVVRRLKIQGFVITDYVERYPEAYKKLAELRHAGKVEWKLEQDAGIENVLSAFRKLYSGGNEGKLLLKVE